MSGPACLVDQLEILQTFVNVAVSLEPTLSCADQPCQVPMYSERILGFAVA